MMRISAFSTGRVRQKRGDRGAHRYLNNDWRDETLPVNVFVIEHPAGLCVVDTGQTAAAAQPGYFPWWYPFFKLSRFELSPCEEAASQITAAGFELGRVRWVVLTHLHTDHAGGVGAFRNAEVIVARAEWEDAQGWRGRIRGYLPQEWPARVEPRVVDFDGPAIGPFPASFDLACDGRLLFVPLPGHTRGHAAVIVRDSEGSFLCAGDAAIRAADLATSQPSVAEWCRRENVTILTSHESVVTPS